MYLYMVVFIKRGAVVGKCFLETGNNLLVLTYCIGIVTSCLLCGKSIAFLKHIAPTYIYISSIGEVII